MERKNENEKRERDEKTKQKLERDRNSTRDPVCDTLKNLQKFAEMRQNYRGKNPGEFVMSPARTRYRIPDKLKIQGKGKRTLKSAKIAEMRQNCRGQTRADLL